MPVDRLAENQALNRHSSINFGSYGQIDTLDMGEITNAEDMVTLDTGQTRKSNRKAAQDVTFSIPLSDKPAVALVELLKRLRGVIKGCTAYYYNENEEIDHTVAIGECSVHTVTYPSTAVANADMAKVQVTMSVWNSRTLPTS